MFSVLGVSAFEYAPWAILNYLTPLTVIVLTALGSKFIIVRIEDDPTTINDFELEKNESF